LILTALNKFKYKTSQMATAKRASQTILRSHDKDLYAWSWDAPVPEGIDPATYVKETNHKEVREWLENEGLAQYATLFQAQNVSGAEVPYLSDENLKQLGISKVGHRIKLLNSAKNFKRTLQNWQRNETIFECQNWHLRPRACVFFPTKYRLTPAAIVVYNPQPSQCGYDMDQIDVTTVRFLVGTLTAGN
jgi:hypothetical protein